VVSIASVTDWFNDLDASAAAKIATALVRVEQGNFSSWGSNHKPPKILYSHWAMIL